MKLTIKEAIKQGYKYAVLEYGEGELVLLENCSKTKKYLLASKESTPYKIHRDVIYDLLDNYLATQEDVADEDGKLNDLICDVDYTDITDKINEVFKNTRYYYPTNIKLIV